MYQVNVPVALDTLARIDRADLIKTLRDLDASRVFLVGGTYRTDDAKRQAFLDLLRREIAFFHKEGFEVAVWYWTFLTPKDDRFTHMVLWDGSEDPDTNCPLDESFIRFAADYARMVASTGVDLILYDDDFRLGFRGHGSFGCLCDLHRDAMQKILKKPLPDDLKSRILSGGANEYRSAWQKAKGDSLKAFARRMREAVDLENPNVRIGISAQITSWDFDGADAFTLARILAGKTRPFLRLSGAPYWTGTIGGSRLQDVIEIERMERSWCDSNAEIVAEGDTYPRPRFAVPSSFLECFDMALRIDGRLSGILKYAVDYTSSPAYERGYADRHLRHQNAYRAIEEYFADKDAVGIRVYEPLNQFETSEVNPEFTPKDVQNLFFRTSVKLFSALGLPTVYAGRGTGTAVFGESARSFALEEAGNGLILDLKAARILQDRGIDTGIRSVGAPFVPTEEIYPSESEHVLITKGSSRILTIDEKAAPESFYLAGDEAVFWNSSKENARHVASYRYENADGMRFYVLGFDAEGAKDSLWRQYLKAEKIADALPWLSGLKIPARLNNAPDVYLIAKEKSGRLAVGLFNLFADDIPDPEIRLSSSFDHVRVFGNRGELSGDTLRLGRIEPYGFCFFEVWNDVNL